MFLKGVQIPIARVKYWAKFLDEHVSCMSENEPIAL